MATFISTNKIAKGGNFLKNVINTDKRQFLQRKMWNPMAHHVSFRVIGPEKEANSVNITNHE